MDIVVVGSVAYDSVTTPFGKADRVLGGAASYFSTAASYFAPVKMVAVVGQDFDQEHIRFFNSRGIDTTGLEVAEGKTFFWEGQYEQALNKAITKTTDLNVFADFKPKIPEAYRDAEAVFLGNIDPDLQYEVTQQVAHPSFVAADTMNYWIEKKRDSLLRLLKVVDILLINDTEAKMLSGEVNLVRAAAAIHQLGPRILVIKLGEYGALMFNESGIFFAPAYPLDRLADPTGCGDTFAGGFVGYLAKTGDLSAKNLRRAVIVGSALASFTIRQFSLDRLKTLTMGEIRIRYEGFQRLVQVENFVD